MGKFISAFESNSNYGGGLVTKKLIELFEPTHSIYAIRNNIERKIIRTSRMLLIWIRTPFIHPIFCMYTAVPANDLNILNFSQTFNMIESHPHKQFSIVIHDTLVQKRMFLNFWIKASENRLLNKAEKIYVLSNKDRRLIRRFYGVDDNKIINLFNNLFPNLSHFCKTVHKNNKYKALFIGSLRRKENYLGFEWFYENVYQHCSDSVEVTCLGLINQKAKDRFLGISFLGFVEDINGTLAQFDFTIAPVIEGAGIKIKVIDSLMNGIPVIGTPKAYEGLGRPNLSYCSNNSRNWIDIMKSDTVFFEYYPPI